MKKGMQYFGGSPTHWFAEWPPADPQTKAGMRITLWPLREAMGSYARAGEIPDTTGWHPWANVFSFFLGDVV